MTEKIKIIIEKIDIASMIIFYILKTVLANVRLQVLPKYFFYSNILFVINKEKYVKNLPSLQQRINSGQEV